MAGRERAEAEPAHAWLQAVALVAFEGEWQGGHHTESRKAERASRDLDAHKKYELRSERIYSFLPGALPGLNVQLPPPQHCVLATSSIQGGRKLLCLSVDFEVCCKVTSFSFDFLEKAVLTQMHI